MIQRIQTLYLLAIVVLMTLVALFPLAWFGSSMGEFSLTAFSFNAVGAEGAQDAGHNVYFLSILVLLTAILPLVNIFLFKNRMLQIRLCVVEMVLLLGTLILEGVYYYLAYRLLADDVVFAQSPKIVLAFPLLSMLFSWLALRGIAADEALVKMVDRIR